MTDDAPTPPPEPFHFAPAEEAVLTRAAGFEIDTDLVRDLAGILKDTDLTEIEVERGDLKIRVARGGTMMAQPVYSPTPPQQQPQSLAGPVPAAAPAETATATAKGDAVKSPMVGTVYMQAQPGNPPFIKVGDTVSEGQTLLIVEAMKTMNPIPSPRAGKVVQLLVSDAQPVEYGEPLVVLE